MFDAIILAGGRGQRLGGRDKAAVTVAGRTLLERSLAAVSDAGQIVVVGPVHTPDGVTQVTEDPPGGGPVAGIAAGLAALTDPPPWVGVLAVDQPDAARALSSLLPLLPTLSSAVDGVCHRDVNDHPQWLLAVYRRPSLTRALAPHGTGHGVSVRTLVEPLQWHYAVSGDEYLGDVDTWADHARWEQRLDDG